MARVVQLHRREATAAANGCGHPGQTRQVVIAVDSQLPRKRNAAGFHGRGTGLDQRIAALGQLLHPEVVVHGGSAVELALLVGQRRQHEAVPHRRAVQESERFEEIRNRHRKAPKIG